MTTTKEILDGLGERLTTEEHFVVHCAKSIEEAREWLDGFRKERAKTMELIKSLQQMVFERPAGIDSTVRRLLLDAANTIQNKENHIALLRGQLAGLTHRAEAAEKTIGLRS